MTYRRAGVIFPYSGKKVLLGTAGWGLRGVRGHVLTGIPDTGVASGDCGQGYGARERGVTGDCWAGFRGIRGWWGGVLPGVPSTWPPVEQE